MSYMHSVFCFVTYYDGGCSLIKGFDIPYVLGEKLIFEKFQKFKKNEKIIKKSQRLSMVLANEKS